MIYRHAILEKKIVCVVDALKNSARGFWNIVCNASTREVDV